MKLSVLCIYPVFPPNSGYKNRCYFLYKEKAKHMKVEMISMTGPNQEGFEKEISKNLTEIKIPKTFTQAQQETKIANDLGVAKEIIYDMTQMFLFEETPEYVDAFLESSKDADFVVATQPFFYPMIKKYSDKKLIYDSHNVEYILKKQLLGQNEKAKDLLGLLFENEKAICANSDIVTVCTANRDDASGFEELYDTPSERIFNVPTGVDLESIDFVSPEKRSFLKAKASYDQKIALFIGSAHKPNIEACDHIIEMAKELPEIRFFFVGTCCNSYDQAKLPKNIELKGMVSNEEKTNILNISNVALNPILTGSGVNVKVLDYMAAGIPVITTKIGARGLGIDQTNTEICELSEFKDVIENSNFDKVEIARKYIEETFDWKIIANSYKNLLEIH